MKPPRFALRLSYVLLLLSSVWLANGCAQGQGRGPGNGQGGGQGGGGGGGGGMPAELQDAIHDLFANHDKFRRSVDITSVGYVSETTTQDPKLAATLKAHIRAMSERLGGGRPVRRWDPAFEEFFGQYEDMKHTFTELESGMRVEVVGTTEDAIQAAHNHAFIILGFVASGDSEMHQPHRAVLKKDGGEADRFRGGPPDARAAKLAATFGARASAGADALIKTLGGQLQAVLKESGPVAAASVCSTTAVTLTEGVAKGLEGLEVKRVTDRPRNPAHAPDELDQAVLDHLRRAGEKAEKAGGETPRILAHLTNGSEGKALRYYRPLVIGEVCLKCHGDRETMPAELIQLFAARYPEDRAHGYRLGDLRGLIRVEARPSPLTDSDTE